MTHQAARTQWTYEDYLLFPDDGKRHELIDGDHLTTPVPNLRHQAVSSNLHRLLSHTVHAKRLGHLFAAPTDVVLSNVDVVQPDLVFVSAARAKILAGTHIHGAPDLVIEILSETTRKTDEMVKRKLYERFGVPEYWIVDPDLETVKVYRMTDTGYLRVAELARETGGRLTTTLFPDLEIPLADIFA